MNEIDWIARDEKLQHLMRSVQAGRIVHALLFTGGRGTGKRTAAGWFARAMLCTGAEKPCGACPACKKALAGLHPDMRVLRPEKNAIRVDEIRDLIDYLSLKPYEGGRHIAIIEQADRMNDSAQNALLKSLEEPSDSSMFILLAESPGALLDTIVSRCRVVRFHELAPEDCARTLEQRGISPEHARTLAGVARGSVGRALEMVADEGFLALRGRVIDSLEALGRSTAADAAAMVAPEKGSERNALDLMELWARDLMAVQNGAEPFERDQLVRLSRSKLDGQRLLRAVMRARRELESNVSWDNVLSAMYFSI